MGGNGKNRELASVNSALGEKAMITRTDIEKEVKDLIRLISEHEKKIDADDLRSWASDLRSGRFKQGRNYLEANGCHCCLGVYGETHGIESKFREHLLAEEDFPVDHILSSEDVQLVFLSMNDGTGPFKKKFSFNEIADVIEQIAEAGES